MAAPVPTWIYEAALLRVVDGDTLEVAVDLGFRVRMITPVRLNGLNCAEHDTPAGDAATAYNTEWLAKIPVLVIVAAKPRDFGDKFGRWLATVWGNDRCLNDDLIASGHAITWNGKGPKPVPPPLPAPAPPAGRTRRHP